MSPDQLLYLIIGIVVLDYIFDQVLDFINQKHSKAEIPEKLKGIYKEDEYARSQAYQKVRSRFGFWTSAFSTLITLGILYFGGFGYLDAILTPYITDPILKSLAFFGVLFVLSDLINLPFSYYSTFVIEERFGFNKMTLKIFVTDKLKGYLLAIILGGVLGYALMWIVTELGQDFWIYALVLITAFILFMNLFYTSLILPLFNKLTPLEDGELKDSINAYAKKVAFPLDNIFVIDGSKRSSKANAFFSGLGKKKKIVLYDTLINDHSKEELVAVLAHEVGHFKKKHIITGLALSIFQMGITFYIMSLLIFNSDLSMALGAEELSIHINFIAFGLLYTPISRLTGLLMNMLSRKNEYEADAFAANTYEAKPLMEALKRLSVSSLSNLTPHPLYVKVNYSHPTLLQRLEAMERL
ncbi:M48 family metallopeptidase [Roseivirga sp. E12]|uniref:M48 family metallopeptidase n=1 Tax=Roseivirga sp. E12 TaxID=2819237 RepID=UPI001ABC377A|nr:M48 family metallopeptidase [Roseivirga sp. E12]MBO3700181.1 M48 family metallopeptidase [Roseivirga sp. E12]